MATPSPYKALLRDASPGRESYEYGRKRSPQASETTSAQSEWPTTDLAAIFRAARGDSRMAQLRTEAVPATGYETRSYSDRENYPLEAAASAGHKDTVKFLLEQREVLDIPEDQISEAIKISAENGHLSVIQVLLDDVAKRQSIASYVESILDAGQKSQQSQVLDFALDLASRHCSTDEAAKLKQKLATTVDKYSGPELSKETVISDFATSCTDGDLGVIKAMIESEHHKVLSSSDIDGGLQLCALNGQDALARMLLDSPSLEGRLPLSGEEAFVAAAASGSVRMMKVFASYWTEMLATTGSTAISRALTTSSENGHIATVRYLVQDLSADVNTPAPDKPVTPRLSKSSWGSGILLDDSPPPRTDPEACQDEPSAVSLISPLQAGLRDFGRFSFSRRDRFRDPKNEANKAAQSQQEQVLMFLLDMGADPNDAGGHSMFPVQLAATTCPLDVVERFISAGADVDRTNDDENALFAAAGRELLAAPLVRRLLAAGATIPQDLDKQTKLLGQALNYFEGNTSRKYFHDIYDPDGHFLESPSLQYVFDEGSGAVLFDLLSQMPEIRTTDKRWTLVLQMAAFLNNHAFVDLLLSRGTDINAIGYYYGTALEAAARCGHMKMVQKILDAGAEINVLEGRWQTALRAAIIGGHADVVNSLLNRGADKELKFTRQRLYINDSEKASENALQLGTQSGSLSVVKILLANGADAATDEPETLHPLVTAAKQGNVGLVEILLDAGAPVNVHGKKHRPYGSIQAEDASPIHAAIAGSHSGIVRLLLSHGADVENNVEGVGRPLSLAASRGDLEILRLLISAGADASDGAALSGAVRNGSIDIAEMLLAAGARAAPELANACRQKRLRMLELLLEKVFDEEDADAAVDEAFALQRLDDSVFQVLLDYAPPTMKRFLEVCAAGSTSSVDFMLSEDGIDVNQLDDEDGDYPLQVAASHLQLEVVRILLSRGAYVNCRSSKHGAPLTAALEACAAPELQRLKSEKAKGLVAQLCLPRRHPQTTYWEYEQSASSSFQQLSDCERIVQLLVTRGANITDDSRPLGPPLHLACLLGSEPMVELVLKNGADINATVGYFENAIFAAIQGGHPDIVELLLEKTPLTKHIQTEFATPLHLASITGNGACVRKLLDNGADATVANADGQTSLTLALKNKGQQGIRFEKSHVETPLEVIIKRARPPRVADDDLVAAAKIGYTGGRETLAALLEIANDMVVSEQVLCHVLTPSYPDDEMIDLLMQRSGGIGVTAKMLDTVRNERTLANLLKHKPVCHITPEILNTQRELSCMKLLLDLGSEVAITEQVVFRALEIGNGSSRRWMYHAKKGEKEVLEMLFDRNQQLAVTEEMLKSVRCGTDIEILLRRLEPGTRISDDVVTAVSKLDLREAYFTMRPLLKFDPKIRLDPDVALRTIEYLDKTAALQMLLEHDPSMPVTEDMFLRVFGQFPTARESDRDKLAELMHTYEKPLILTDEVRDVIDHAYQSKSDASKKERFYSLSTIEEAD